MSYHGFSQRILVYFVDYHQLSISIKIKSEFLVSFRYFFHINVPSVFRRSCKYWVLAGLLLLMVVNADNYWMPTGRSSDDHKGSVVESERELVVSICDSCARVRSSIHDRSWLVVISVVCASLRRFHTEDQSCDKLSTVDNNKDMEQAMIKVLSQASALCNWLPLRRRCYMNTGDWSNHLLSRSCSDITCSEHTSSLKLCRCHS